MELPNNGHLETIEPGGVLCSEVKWYHTKVSAWGKRKCPLWRGVSFIRNVLYQRLHHYWEMMQVGCRGGCHSCSIFLSALMNHPVYAHSAQHSAIENAHHFIQSECACSYRHRERPAYCEQREHAACTDSLFLSISQP